jgi:ABC-type lipoprotein release transport system permease subunit
MGRVVLVFRLASRDLRRRPMEAALLLLAMTAATTTLALGLVLHGVTDDPYHRTRAATAGPDVIAQADPPTSAGAGHHVRRSRPATAGRVPRPARGPQGADLASLRALAGASGVAGHSGPYPLAQATVAGHGDRAVVQVEGRDRATASIDQPALTQGSWVRAGGVVLERSFAEALGVKVGERIVIGARSWRIVGTAVTAAMAPYPSLTLVGPTTRAGAPVHPGLAWATVADARSLAPTPASLSYVLNLKLTDPAAAPAFVDRRSRPDGGAPPDGRSHPPVGVPPFLETWQHIGDANANLARNERRALLTGSWLMGLLALAGLAVLVGGRIVDQNRRVGLLKAVGALPSLVASLLLAEYLFLAALAAAAGLAIARLAAPPLTDPGAGLLGSPGTVAITLSTVAVVTAVALAVALAATLVPAIRAARTSTVLALSDAARQPRRDARLIAVSARLPVPLLLGLRLAARRPRRALLGVASVAVTVSGIVVVLAAHAQLQAEEGSGSSGLADPRADRLGHVLAVITVVLVVQSAVNAIFITWANVLDARRSSALARALGATPRQVSGGVSAAQVLPALGGAVLGIPGGIALLAAVSPDPTTIPAPWWLLAALLGAPLAMAALTALPARASARRPVAEILRSELA